MEVQPFTKGSRVEVSSDDDGFRGAWYVATVVDIVDASKTKKRAYNKKNRDKKIVGYYYLVKYATLFQENQDEPLTETHLEPLTETVHPSHVRPVAPRNPRRNDGNQVETEEGSADFQLNDVVDAYLRDGWWIGVVRKVIGDGEMKKYLVSFETPPEELELEGSQLRLHVDWVDSLWKLPPQKVTNAEGIGEVKRSVTYHRTRRVVNLEEEENLHENLQSSTPMENSGSKGNTEEIVSVMETSGNGAQAKHQDSLILEQETIIEDGNSQLKRKRGTPSKSQSQEPNGSLEENSCYNSHEHDVASLVNDSQTTENQHVWPFVKRSPIWAAIESLYVYQNLTQKPHFSPLWEVKEDRCEGLAVAHMVTFDSMVQRVTNLKWTDPNHAINSSLETLVDLEANGFDVGPVRARLDKLLATKSEAGRLEGEMKEVEKAVDKCNREKMAIDEQIKGLERKMREMEEQMARAVAIKYEKDDEILVIRSRLQGVSKRIVDLKVAFQDLVRSPL